MAGMATRAPGPAPVVRTNARTPGYPATRISAALALASSASQGKIASNFEDSRRSGVSEDRYRRNFSGLAANSPRGGNGEISLARSGRFVIAGQQLRLTWIFWSRHLLGLAPFGSRSFLEGGFLCLPRRGTRGSGPRVRQPDEALIRRKSRARGLSVPPGRAFGSALLRHRQRRIRCKKTVRLMHAKAVIPHLQSADVFRKKRSRS
jgi:hypothetical protein